MSGSPRGSDKRMKNNIQLGQCQQVLPLEGRHPDLDSRNIFGMESVEKRVGIGGIAKDQQAPGCLGIEKDISHFRRNGVANEDVLAEELLVAAQATCTKALPAIIQHAREQWATQDDPFG